MYHAVVLQLRNSETQQLRAPCAAQHNHQSMMRCCGFVWQQHDCGVHALQQSTARTFPDSSPAVHNRFWPQHAQNGVHCCACSFQRCKSGCCTGCIDTLFFKVCFSTHQCANLTSFYGKSSKPASCSQSVATHMGCRGKHHHLCCPLNVVRDVCRRLTAVHTLSVMCWATL